MITHSSTREDITNNYNLKVINGFFGGVLLLSTFITVFTYKDKLAASVNQGWFMVTGALAAVASHLAILIPCYYRTYIHNLYKRYNPYRWIWHSIISFVNRLYLISLVGNSSAGIYILYGGFSLLLSWFGYMGEYENMTMIVQVPDTTVSDTHALANETVMTLGDDEKTFTELETKEPLPSSPGPATPKPKLPHQREQSITRIIRNTDNDTVGLLQSRHFSARTISTYNSSHGSITPHKSTYPILYGLVELLLTSVCYLLYYSHINNVNQVKQITLIAVTIVNLIWAVLNQWEGGVLDVLCCCRTEQRSCSAWTNYIYIDYTYQTLSFISCMFVTWSIVYA